MQKRNVIILSGLYGSNFMRIVASVLVFFLLVCSEKGYSQFVPAWVENFDTSKCTGGQCYAEAYAGWTVTAGANGALPNRWFVGCNEVGGKAKGACGTRNCSSANGTLHIGSTIDQANAFPPGTFPCTTGDCGATYFTGPGGATTDYTIESPSINCSTTNCDMFLSFYYFLNGQAGADYLEVEYFDGTSWSPIATPPPTASCNTNNGTWDKLTIQLPASAKANPGIKIGFRWVNDDDGAGSDPAVAIDSFLVYSDLSFVDPPTVSMFTIPSGSGLCAPAVFHLTPDNVSSNYFYSWQVNGVNQNPPDPNVLDVTFNTPGKQSIKLTATNLCTLNGTPFEKQFTIVNCSTPKVSFGPPDTPLCRGACITFRDTVLAINPVYKWTFEGGDISTSNQPRPTVCFNTDGGPYKIKLVITDGNNKKDSAEHTIINVSSCTPPAVPQFVAAPNPQCEGDPIHFTDASLNAAEWHWDFTGGTPSSFDGVAPPDVTYATAGDYTVTLTVKNSAGDPKSISNTITIKVCGPPTADFEAQQNICAETCVQFFDKSTGDPVTWEWTFTDGTPSFSSQQDPGYICYDSPGTHDVSLKVINSKGDNTATRAGYITVFPNPTASMTVNGTPNVDSITVISGTPVALVASGGKSYQWYPPLYISADSVSDPIVSPIDTIVYTVTVTDENGCTGQKSVLINAFSQTTIFVPNIFSPNKDHVNDYFKAYAAGFIEEFEFRVFDRWGTEIFFTDDVNYAWDGTFAGKDSPVGVYVWFYKAKFPDGKTFKGKGDVTLIR